MPLILDGTKGETFPSWTTATRPATPNAGQTGYNTTLATLERYNGTTWGPVVTTADSGTVTPTMLSQPLTLGTAQASTSGTSIDFTSIPSWVKRITVMFNGVSTNGASAVQIQIGSGSVTTTGYLGTAGDLVGNTASNYTTGFGTQTAGNATHVRHGSVVIKNVSGNIWVADGLVVLSNAAQIYMTGGSISLSGTLDRVRVTTVNGTDAFDAGSINILYE